MRFDSIYVDVDYIRRLYENPENELLLVAATEDVGGGTLPVPSPAGGTVLPSDLEDFTGGEGLGRGDFEIAGEGEF